jgi:hypothetical protein
MRLVDFCFDACRKGIGAGIVKTVPGGQAVPKKDNRLGSGSGAKGSHQEREKENEKENLRDSSETRVRKARRHSCRKTTV